MVSMHHTFWHSYIHGMYMNIYVTEKYPPHPYCHGCVYVGMVVLCQHSHNSCTVLFSCKCTVERSQPIL